jgi:hypothetical protein
MNTRVGRSGVRIPADPAGNGIFPESFRPVPRILPREPAGKPTEGGSSIPDGISPYLKQDFSNFFPGTENLGKQMDLAGNKREPPGNAPEIWRIQTDSSSKRIHLSDFNHIRKKNTKNPALGFLFHES